MTHDMLQPSDELIERALARRAAHGADPDLLRSITAAAASTRQARRWWPVGLPGMGEPARQIVVVAIVLMLMATFALGAVVGSRPQIESSVVPTPTASPSPTSNVTSAAAWTATGSMVTPREGHTATLLLDGSVLVVGGFAGSSAASLASAELYDPVTATWAATGSMTATRIEHTATLLSDGRVLVAGGTPADFSALTFASAELYDPATGTWTATGDMTEPHLGHVATLLPDGRVLVAGGLELTGKHSLSDRYARVASAELYDPVTGTWTATRDMAQARHGHSATLLPNGLVLVAGGYDRHRLPSAELYDPVSGTWTPTGDMTEPYGGHTATLLPDGTVLVAGGDVPRGGGAVGSAHAALYDPATGAWTAIGDMRTAPLGHTATLLPDGRVLVSGGKAYGGPEAPRFDDAELYDPVTGTWTATADMTQARDSHTATLLPDGRVLVAGGTRDVVKTGSAELYDAH